MQVIGLCRFSYPAIGGFQVEHETIADRMEYLYATERMEERFRTFEAITLPPLQAQTDPDFTFLILVGDSMPTPYMDRLKALVGGMPQAVIQVHPPGPHRQVMQDAINSVRHFDEAPCLQFRMDDDDAVARTYVARLREVAHDVAPFAARHRHIAIDFNQGFILRPAADGLWAAQTSLPYTTPGLALMVRPDVRLSIMNFSHSRVGQKMPTVTITGEDMMVRGHNDFNDSRQKPGVKPVKLERLDTDGEAYLHRVYGIKADLVRRLYSALDTTRSR